MDTEDGTIIVQHICTAGGFLLTLRIRYGAENVGDILCRRCGGVGSLQDRRIAEGERHDEYKC